MTTVTIRDVADEAGVSVATVSRALRGLPSVAPTTREKVEKAAERLDYIPDPYAAALSATKAHTIMVAVPLPGQWYYAQIMAAVEGMASAAGYDLQLRVAGDDVQRSRFVEDAMRQSRRIDGVILVDIPADDGAIETLLERGLVMIGVGQHTEGIITVNIDNKQAGKDAANHLIERGHRRIAVLGGMPEVRDRPSIPGEREAGYVEALEEAGIAVDQGLMVNGNFSISGGREATRLLMSMDDPPSAVFALSDEMAAGALQAAWELGLGVPGDLEVMGFDDHDFAEPMGLTTIRQPVAQQGECAMQALLDAVEGEPWKEDRVLEHELIQRNTTSSLED